MATFTVTLEEAIEFTGGAVEIVDGRAVYTPGKAGIGLEHYPLHDPTHRDTLNGLIIDQYWNREIAHETVSMFAQRLRTHMNLNMPQFNMLYEAHAIEFDILTNTNVRSTSRSEGSQKTESVGESTTENKTKNEARSVFSDTPQTMLSGSEDYASNATDANSWTDTEGAGVETATAEATSENDNDAQTIGYNGTPASIIREYQELRLNIDMLVVQSLDTLFMGVWNNGDSYTSRSVNYYGL